MANLGSPPNTAANLLPQTLSQLLAQVPSSQFSPDTSAAEGIYQTADKATQLGQPIPPDTLAVMKQINTNSQPDALHSSIVQAIRPQAPIVRPDTDDIDAPHVNGEEAYKQANQEGEAVAGPNQGAKGPAQYGGNFTIDGKNGPASFVDAQGNPTGSPFNGSEDPHSATAEFTKSMQDAYHNGNPLQLLGGLFNALMPEKGKVDAQGNPIIDTSTGQQQTMTQSENPNSLLSLVKSAIPSFLAPNLLNKTSQAFGLGSMHPDQDAGTGGVDLFKNSNQTLDPDLKARANADYNKMMADRTAATMGGFPATRYANDQTAFQKDIDAVQSNLESQQKVGIGTQAESDSFKKQGQDAGAIVLSAKNWLDAIKTGNPQQMGVTLEGLTKQGDLADALAAIPGASDMLTAVKTGTFDHWLQLDPKTNTAVAAKVKGALKGAIQNATVEATNANRLGDQILPIKKDAQGNYDQTDPNYAIAKKFAPTFGQPNGGLPVDEINAAIDHLDDPTWKDNFNEQGLDQAAAAAHQASEQGPLELQANAEGKLAAGNKLATKSNPPKPSAAPLEVPTDAQAIKDAQNGDVEAQKYATNKGLKWR